MSIDNIFKQALQSGQPALTEFQAKQVLNHYQIPVVTERVAATPDQAVQVATETGFPVVLKGMGSKLLHKTERGLVHLNLSDGDRVRQAAEKVVKEAAEDLEGILIQPQLESRREFVAGLFRDPQFGPVVMFGIGGILTEALSDVAFCLAPVSKVDVLDMLAEIKAAALLGDFRGEKAINIEQLTEILVAIGKLGSDHPSIAEIDINPLLATPEGNLIAVDALIVTGEPESITSDYRAVDPAAIGALIYPKSIAFVGASAQMGKWGNMLMANTISGEYGGEIYLVNPKGGTIAGRPVYRSIDAIPGPVDLAVVTIPAALVLDLIAQMRQKAIKNMLLITSGFGETGPEGKQLEKELVRAAREAGILVLGPNTMGICNPHNQLYCTGSPVRPLAGSTAVVAQSGNMGTQLLAFAESQGIGIRAFSGSGNEAMITIEDYMEGFEIDDLTRTVMLYIESVKNGRRFYESACRVGRKKPIVLLKGGQTGAGNRAAASHTGAMSSDAKVFNAVCRQAGIIKVDRSMDLLDLSAAFASVPLPRGNRAAIMTLGGGWGVITADLCANFGLEVPSLPDSILSVLDDILPSYWSRANPVDIVGENDPAIPLTTLEELLKWDGCDAVINLGIVGRRIFVERMAAAVRKADASYPQEILDMANQMLVDFEKKYIAHVISLMHTYAKPIFGVSLLTDQEDQTVYRVGDDDYKGLFYETPERAVKAFARMFEYQRYLSKRE
ncbi:MAG: CoA-binding protein [Desulfobacterales bacterium]|nr:CoA-binding protein [Desulfobacterales bacterium]